MIFKFCVCVLVDVCIFLLFDFFLLGTRAPPREIVLDNSMLPTEPESIRVHTPPRVITLDKYQFPMVDDKLDDNMQKDVIPVVKPRAKFNLSEKETRIVRR